MSSIDTDVYMLAQATNPVVSDVSVSWQPVRQFLKAANVANKVLSNGVEHLFCIFCFLILLLDLSESWNCPTNKEFHDRERSERRIKQHPHTQTHSVMYVLRSQPEIQEKPAQSHICCSIYFLKSLWAWHHLSLFHQSQRLHSQGGFLTCSWSLILNLFWKIFSALYSYTNDWNIGLPCNVVENVFFSHDSTLRYS